VEGIADITDGAPVHPHGNGTAGFARLVLARLG
jgi:hypothetical protein